MAVLIIRLLQLMSIVFIIRALLSWIPISGSSPFYPVVRAVYQVTEPILSPVRRALPPIGGLDLSVIAVILLINYLLVPIVRGLPL